MQGRYNSRSCNLKLNFSFVIMFYVCVRGCGYLLFFLVLFFSPHDNIIKWIIHLPKVEMVIFFAKDHMMTIGIDKFCI